jgi:heterodisulfide reductase subunit C2
MTWVLENSESRQALLRQVEGQVGQHLAKCYQCGKCTAGCPSAYAMDYPPNQIIRGIQLGMRDQVLASHTIWLCASCETCTTRCPQGVDVAGVMDALRRIARAQGIRPPEKEVSLFHRTFLGSIRQHGRIFEVGLMGILNVFSGHLLKDVALAPGMLLKGKLSLIPPRGKNKGLKKMFAMAKKLEANAE